MEPLLRENPGRFVVLPIEYPEVWTMYKKAQGKIKKKNRSLSLFSSTVARCSLSTNLLCRFITGLPFLFSFVHPLSSSLLVKHPMMSSSLILVG